MDRTQLGSQRVKASTVLEVVIAMVIIVVVFGIGMMITGNVLRANLSIQHLRAKQILKDELIKAEEEKDPQNATLRIDDIEIERYIIDSTGFEGVRRIYLKAYDRNHQLIAEVQKIIKHDN